MKGHLMYKDNNSAREIIEMQEEDGSWGIFHTLSEPNKNPLTTEQALRRLQVLGFDINDKCIRKSVDYMTACLIGDKEIPDLKEKTHDNQIFRDMMLSTWIRKFTKDNKMANEVALKWSKIISHAFQTQSYNHDAYLKSYEQTFGKKANGDRLVDFVNYYQVSLIGGLLSAEIEKKVLNHILNHRNGIYYIGYRKKLSELPIEFTSKQTVKFLACIEHLKDYTCLESELDNVVKWIYKNAHDKQWDLGTKCKDKIYMPLSDTWRSKENRVKDSTYFVRKILDVIKG